MENEIIHTLSNITNGTYSVEIGVQNLVASLDTSLNNPDVCRDLKAWFGGKRYSDCEASSTNVFAGDEQKPRPLPVAGASGSSKTSTTMMRRRVPMTTGTASTSDVPKVDEMGVT